jgi:1,4-alpha-glucan branching enzyme
MGNEFGHPEWIDFPREGNNWSYAHARRIWSIAENSDLRYHWLSDFDAQMIRIIKENELLNIPEVWKIWENKADQVLSFTRGNLLFVFNFSPSNSYVDYGLPFEPFRFKLLLNTDSAYYGGYGRFDERIVYYTMPEDKGPYANLLKLYLPSRTALVFEIEAI